MELSKFEELVDEVLKVRSMWDRLDKDEKSTFSLCGSCIDSLHLYTGIEAVAKFFNCELSSKDCEFSDGSRMTLLSFEYKGLKIIQFAKEEGKENE